MIHAQYNLRLCVKNEFYCAPFFYMGILLAKYLLVGGRIQKVENKITAILTGAEIMIFSFVYETETYMKISVNIRVINY